MGALPVQRGDDECVSLDAGVANSHGHRVKCLNGDADLLVALASHCLLGRLTGLDVAAHKVPVVGVPASVWMSVHQQHASILNQQGQSYSSGLISHQAMATKSVAPRSVMPRRCSAWIMRLILWWRRSRARLAGVRGRAAA